MCEVRPEEEARPSNFRRKQPSLGGASFPLVSPREIKEPTGARVEARHVDVNDAAALLWQQQQRSNNSSQHQAAGRNSPSRSTSRGTSSRAGAAAGAGVVQQPPPGSLLPAPPLTFPDCEPRRRSRIRL